MEKQRNWSIPIVALATFVIFLFFIIKILNGDSKEQIAASENGITEQALIKDSLPEVALERNYSSKSNIEGSLSPPKRLQILEEKAMTAFEDGRYLSPEGDNAVKYTQEILVLDSTNALAVELIEMIFEEYQKKAKIATRNSRLDTAINYYSKILAITPENSAVQKELVAMISLNVKRQSSLKATPDSDPSTAMSKPPAKSDNESTRDLNTRVDSFQEPNVAAVDNTQYQRLNSEDKRSKVVNSPVENVIVTSLSNSNAITIPENMNQNGHEVQGDDKKNSAKQAYGADKNLIITSLDKSNVITLNGAPSNEDLNSQNTIAPARTPGESPRAPASQSPAIDAIADIPIVDLALIDGGKPEYLHKEKPGLPRNWAAGKFSMLRGECIVGVNGQVEDVRIISILSPGVSPKEYEPLIDLTVQTLMKYKFKPATFNGDPTRFKIIETLNYR